MKDSIAGWLPSADIKLRGPQRSTEDHRGNAADCHPLTACADAGGKSEGDWAESFIVRQVFNRPVTTLP